MALAGGQADLTAISDQMVAKMTHGDWFQVDRMSAERAQVVLGRIGIGIFNREPQPVWNDDYTIALLMAGQLHAHPSGEEDLSESDERLVLRTYERFGD